MGDLNEVQLGESGTHFIDGDRSKRYPKREEFVESGVLFLNAASINTGSIDKDAANRISEKKYSDIKKGRIKRNDILLTTRGNGVGDVVYVNISEPGLINAQMLILRADEKKIIPRFLYYYLSSKTLYSYIWNFASGSAQPQIPIRDLRKIPLRLPETETQQNIAAILAAYDDLIEVNKRRIALLEKMAEELYHEWFVRMRFPGHQNIRFVKGVPEGWEMKFLPELVNITYGFPFQSPRFNTTGNGKPIIRIRNIQKSSSNDYTDELAVDKYLVEAGDLIVGMDGEFHMNHWYGDQAYLVQRVCRIKEKDPKLAGYIALAIRAPIKHFEAILACSGATVGHLGAKHLNSIRVLVPPEDMNGDVEFLNHLFEQKFQLSLANRNLTITRDLLLPRLISGKLPVEDLDIQFPPSMQEDASH